MTPQSSSSSNSRAVTLWFVAHCAALLSVAIPMAVLHSSLAKPFARLFFCNDASLAYPLKPETVPFALACGLGLAVAVATVLVVEAVRLAACQEEQEPAKSFITGWLERCMSERSAGYVTASLAALYTAGFGILCTGLVTQSCKLGFGRHRPYFLAACRLNVTAAACQAAGGGPFSVARCTAPNDRLLAEARVSFPSGHTSYCVFLATYLALYLQARLAFKQPAGHAMKNVAQLVLFLLAIYVGMTRVSDYRHHWSDVLGGGIIGLAIGCLLSFRMAAGLSIYRRQLPTSGAASGGSYELLNGSGLERQVTVQSP